MFSGGHVVFIFSSFIILCNSHAIIPPMSGRLGKLEARIEQLVEGTFSRLLAGRLQPREVAVRLARAMEDNARPAPKGGRFAPTGYRVRLNPEDAAALEAASPDLAAGLASELVNFARELGLSLTHTPLVSVEPDPAVELNGILVEPASGAASTETQPMAAVSTAAKPTKAFLIINGERHMTLDRAVITLGRRLDNTVILDDPRVSRHHAQLRQRYGRWVLYDLGSASGTMVNNHRVDECLLRPGDVISLAGVTLIYGEEETDADHLDDTGHTRPLPARPEGDAPNLKAT